jgi:hypothetical protein
LKSTGWFRLIEISVSMNFGTERLKQTCQEPTKSHHHWIGFIRASHQNRRVTSSCGWEHRRNGVPTVHGVLVWCDYPSAILYVKDPDFVDKRCRISSPEDDGVGRGIRHSRVAPNPIAEGDAVRRIIQICVCNRGKPHQVEDIKCVEGGVGDGVAIVGSSSKTEKKIKSGFIMVVLCTVTRPLFHLHVHYSFQIGRSVKKSSAGCICRADAGSVDP